jgi:hypothetical protein
MPAPGHVSGKTGPKDGCPVALAAFEPILEEDEAELLQDGREPARPFGIRSTRRGTHNRPADSHPLFERCARPPSMILSVLP